MSLKVEQQTTFMVRYNAPYASRTFAVRYNAPYASQAFAVRYNAPCGRLKGFTLLELLIAAALLSVLVGIALPSINGLLNRRQRYDVLGQVEVFLTNERREAGVSAEVCWFRYSSADRWLISGKLGQPVATSLQLPESYQFSRSEIVEQLESEDLGSLGLEAANLSWSPEFLFFPDGTADDVAFAVIDPDEQEFQVSVRGLTGQVSIQRTLPPAEVPR